MRVWVASELQVVITNNKGATLTPLVAVKSPEYGSFTVAETPSHTVVVPRQVFHRARDDL